MCEEKNLKMSKIFWKSLLTGSAAIGVALSMSVANKAQADTVTPAQDSSTVNQLDKYSSEGQVNTKDQISSVSELRDVAPTDWAYEALRSLVERYGCIVGYPDRTYRGNKPLTRWEFAAGLNACMNTLERLIQENSVSKEDIEKLKRLIQEFQSELAALGAKVDNLEGRVSFLENHQFSTTTKLSGEVIFSVAGATNADAAVVFQDRVRLLFDTTFSGQDVLHARLAAGNVAQFASPYQLYDPFTNTTYTNYAPSPATTLASGVGVGLGNNSVAIDWLTYQGSLNFGPGVALDTYVAAVNGAWYDFVPTGNPYFNDYDGGGGALSAFAQVSPIYRIGGGSGAGITLKLGFLDNVLGSSTGSTGFSIGYLATNASSPAYGQGLFGGGYGILGQLSANVANIVNLGLTYVNGYAPAGTPVFGMGGSYGLVGTNLANGLPSPNGQYNPGTNGNKSINSYGFQASITPFHGVSLSAFFDYTNVNYVGSSGYSPNTFIGAQGSADVWSYGGGIAVADLFKEGSILGFYGGVQPDFGNVTVYNSTNGNYTGQVNNGLGGSPVHLELFYKYPVTDNISVTPGVIWLNNPTQLAGSSSQLIGVVRGTYKF